MLSRLPSQPGAVNIPTAVAVYIELTDGCRAVAKFCKSRVLDKVLEESGGSTAIFGDTLISQNYSVA